MTGPCKEFRMVAWKDVYQAPRWRICRLTCALGICGDEFGGEVDAGLVCYGLMEDET